MPALPERPSRRLVEAVGLLLLAGLLVGLAVAPVLSIGADATGPDPASPAGSGAGPLRGAAPELRRLTGPLHEPALIVVADRALGPRTAAVRRHPEVAHLHRFGLASVVVAGRSVNVAAADPATYRAFTDARTARSQPVWEAVARGELAVTHRLADDLGLVLGGPVPLDGGGSATLRLGAVATTVPGVDAVATPAVGLRLGVPADNALLVALRPDADREEVARALEGVLGDATVHPVQPATTATGGFSARLVGGSVADAVGSFAYRWYADGRVEPDPAWVAANIVTAEVPILGSVTCHRVLVGPLRDALQSVLDAGLTGALDPGDYGGCYVPRFIDRDPRRGLSLHTWGIAVDLNVATNQLGTRGSIDPRVVELFRRQGFAWGGTWRRPDPMHFELATLVAPG